MSLNISSRQIICPSQNKNRIYSVRIKDRWLNVNCYSLGGVGSVFDECGDDEFVATTSSDVKGSVSALVLTVNLSSYSHINQVFSLELQCLVEESIQNDNHANLFGSCLTIF